MKILQALYDFVLSPALLATVLLSGIYCTLRLGLPFLLHPFRVVRDLLRPVDGKPRLSSVKALTVALAGTLGVGNIAGVASAITAGGPGAVFWMWIGALVSMLVKYAEVVLAIRYRKSEQSGFIGGAMYYFGRPWMASLFAVFCLVASFALGNLMQAETVARSAKEAFGLSPLLCGILLALILYFAICRGFSRISTVTLCLVPLMSGIYVLLCLYAIGSEIAALPGVIARIFRSAFSPSAALGGAGGLILARVIRAGISRGLITHEAGCGTAPMAHAGADTDSAVRQGFWGIFEVFADTILLCSLTAFVILLHQDRFPGLSGMALVNAAFGVSLGRWAAPLMAILIFCFAVATMIGWSHYGQTCLNYLTRDCNRRAIYKKLYALAYSLMGLFGALMASDLMWLLADYSVALMTLLHLPCLLSKLSEVAAATRIYFAQSARSLENTCASAAARANSKDL